MINVLKRILYKHWIVFISAWIWLGFYELDVTTDIGTDGQYWGFFLVVSGVSLLVSEKEFIPKTNQGS